MKEIICMSCEKIWYVQDTDIERQKLCPFCGEKGNIKISGINFQKQDNEKIVEVLEMLNQEIPEELALAKWYKLRGNYSKALELFRNIANTKGDVSLYSTVAELYRLESKLSKAKVWEQKALEADMAQKCKCKYSEEEELYQKEIEKIMSKM